jgi:hypothetical protein
MTLFSDLWVPDVFGHVTSGPVLPGYGILTEDGDYLRTEDGDFIIQDYFIIEGPFWPL